MARQLLQDRTPAGYAGVEAFARRHAKEDAGALAWLVLGYGHILDRDYVKAIDPLNRAKPHAGISGTTLISIWELPTIRPGDWRRRWLRLGASIRLIQSHC